MSTVLGKTHHMIHCEHCTWPKCLMCVHICVWENEWHSTYAKSPCYCMSYPYWCVWQVPQTIQ